MREPTSSCSWKYIAVQEDCVFPMIAQTLCEADKSVLREALQAGGGGKADCACNTYVDVANRLADDFDVPRAVMVGAPRPSEREEPPK